MRRRRPSSPWRRGPRSSADDDRCARPRSARHRWVWPTWIPHGSPRRHLAGDPANRTAAPARAALPRRSDRARATGRSVPPPRPIARCSTPVWPRIPPQSRRRPAAVRAVAHICPATLRMRRANPRLAPVGGAPSGRPAPRRGSDRTRSPIPSSGRSPRAVRHGASVPRASRGCVRRVRPAPTTPDRFGPGRRAGGHGRRPLGRWSRVAPAPRPSTPGHAPPPDRRPIATGLRASRPSRPAPANPGRTLPRSDRAAGSLSPHDRQRCSPARSRRTRRRCARRRRQSRGVRRASRSRGRLVPRRRRRGAPGRARDPGSVRRLPRARGYGPRWLFAGPPTPGTRPHPSRAARSALRRCDPRRRDR